MALALHKPGDKSSKIELVLEKELTNDVCPDRDTGLDERYGFAVFGRITSIGVTEASFNICICLPKLLSIPL
jgi:hypothetical protein